MRLTVQDGQRQVTIADRKTKYAADTLADWSKQAGALLAEQNFPPISTHPVAVVEKAAQFDHDTRQPLGFAGKAKP